MRRTSRRNGHNIICHFVFLFLLFAAWTCRFQRAVALATATIPSTKSTSTTFDTSSSTTTNADTATTCSASSSTTATTTTYESTMPPDTVSYTDDATTASTTDSSSSSSSTSSSSSSSSSDSQSTSSSLSFSALLLCTADGKLYSMDAWTGVFRSRVLYTQPLIASQHHQGEDENPNAVISLLPGLDGRLYWQDPTSSSTNEDGQPDQDDDDGALQELPLTMQSLLNNPVRSCENEFSDNYEDFEEDPNEGDFGDQDSNCGILTATVETSLFALDESGELLWSKEGTKTTSASSSSSSEASGAPPLLLQRKDFHVHHISSQTGLELWNVSLGTWQALDFDAATDSSEPDENDIIDMEDDLYLPGRSQDKRETLVALDADFDDIDNGYDILYFEDGTEERRQRPRVNRNKRSVFALPSILFSNAGRTLEAVDPFSHEILWKMTTNSVVASVFGMHRGRWRAVHVLTDEQGRHLKSVLNKGKTRQLPSYVEEIDHRKSSNPMIDDLLQRTWYRHYTENYLKQQNTLSHPQLQLPSPTSSSAAPTRSSLSVPSQTPQSVCLVPDGSGHCPNLKQAPLRLPSPTYASSYSTFTNHTTVQPEGLLLSWTMVLSLIVMALITLLGGVLFYRHKKRQWFLHVSATVDKSAILEASARTRSASSQWLATSAATLLSHPASSRFLGNGDLGETSFSAVPGPSQALSTSRTISCDDPGLYFSRSEFEFKASETMSIDLSAKKLMKASDRSNTGLFPRRKLLTRSNSLPLELDTKDQELQPTSTVPKRKSIYTTALVDSSSNTSKTMGSRPGNECNIRSAPQSPTAATSTVATTLTPLGGIPLVRYSRYASEFIEVEALGKGGFGTVFKCRNALDGREYAVKKVIIRNGGSINTFQERLERVLREVKILAVLDHPNIVRYYTAWLELEEGTSNNDDETQGGTTTLSRCYSSSCIVADSKSNWQASPQPSSSWAPSRKDKTPLQHQRNMQKKLFKNQNDNPLGWTNGLSEESLQRRSFCPSSDCGFIFERSDEDVSNSQEYSQSESGCFLSKDRMNRLPYDNHYHPVIEDSDCGLVFEEDSNEGDENANIDNKAVSSSFTGNGTSTLSENIVADSRSSDKKALAELRHPNSAIPVAGIVETSSPSKAESAGKGLRHTLYIQMQLCTQKTLGDFLSNSEARICAAESPGEVNIPTALGLFVQIAQAVKHVHEQGLIHRDLKPQNCFMDEYGTVKVGDFGLSRESGENREEEEKKDSGVFIDFGHTAGVGTRSYASPEQMTGSDYDSSADVYSLGVMLFELLYPMYTGMERTICLGELRQSKLPNDWDQRIGIAFPTLHGLIKSMVSPKPSDRPTATSVVEHIQLILSEFTLVSLDENKHQGPDIILLRVEAQHRADALGETLKAIHESSQGNATVMQYGLRSSSNDEQPSAIMEFAIRFPGTGAELVRQLQQRPDIYKVRQVSATFSSANGTNGTRSSRSCSLG